MLRYVNENMAKQWDPCIICSTNFKVNFTGKSAHYTWVNTVIFFFHVTEITVEKSGLLSQFHVKSDWLQLHSITPQAFMVFMFDCKNLNNTCIYCDIRGCFVA